MEVSFAGDVARVLRTLFSDRSISPLSGDQTTFFVSRCMIEECDEKLTSAEVREVFDRIRSIAKEEGFA